MVISRVSGGWIRQTPVGRVTMSKNVAMLANTNFEKQQKQYPSFQSYEEYVAWEEEQAKVKV
jgi:hypothetical protein